MECFQSSFSFFCLARSSSVAPTSTLAIGAPPAGAADPDAIEGDRVLGVLAPLGCATPPGCACARPKMADMMFAKMLILLLLARGSMEALPQQCLHRMRKTPAPQERFSILAAREPTARIALLPGSSTEAYARNRILFFRAAAFAAILAERAGADFLAVVAIAAFIERPRIATQRLARREFRVCLHRARTPVVGAGVGDGRLGIKRLAAFFGGRGCGGDAQHEGGRRRQQKQTLGPHCCSPYW